MCAFKFDIAFVDGPGSIYLSFLKEQGLHKTCIFPLATRLSSKIPLGATLS